VPYRIDIARPPADVLDRLLALGALDVDRAGTGVAAILPDHVSREAATRALAVGRLKVSSAVGRDDDSVWLVSPRPTRVGPLVIVPEEVDTPPTAIRLADSAAFGTGLHPTTALSIEALARELESGLPDVVLDVGTGSGILALAALRLGVPRAVAVDTDPAAVAAAARNAHLNGLVERVRLVTGGPEVVDGLFPLILANILPAPLIEMATVLVRRLSHQGRLVLSGIPVSAAQQVEDAYRHCGLRGAGHETRSGWSALIFQATW
jgi:ribosomal protein L11 methyltransferase